MVDSLREIIETCLQLEGLAIQLYRKFADRFEDPVKSFWIRMKDQEKEHVRYWRTLSDLAEKGEIRNVFDHPDQVLSELQKTTLRVREILKEAETPCDLEACVMHAYHLEFIMLHPAFEAMFYLMRDKTGDRSPSVGYLNHIHQLIEMLHTLGKAGAEFELIAELTERLWNQNHLIAEQLAHIREVRGLIPICMHCKNIRNDDGFWQKVETYVEGHSHAEFSHGVCPVCLRKHYSDVLSEEDLREMERGGP